jgi:hypothetical protein
MGCVIPHQSNAANIPHQTNAGLKPIVKKIWWEGVGRIDLLHEIKCVLRQVVGPFKGGIGNFGIHQMWEM